jgi:hypothetical protein
MEGKERRIQEGIILKSATQNIRQPQIKRKFITQPRILQTVQYRPSVSRD